MWINILVSSLINFGKPQESISNIEEKAKTDEEIFVKPFNFNQEYENKNNFVDIVKFYFYK